MESRDQVVVLLALLVVAGELALGHPPDEVRHYLTRAVTLAPADSDARLNLGLVETAQGNISKAVRQVENASFVHKSQKGTDFAPAQPVKRNLVEYQQESGIR